MNNIVELLILSIIGIIFLIGFGLCILQSMTGAWIMFALACFFMILTF